MEPRALARRGRRDDAVQGAIRLLLVAAAAPIPPVALIIPAALLAHRRWAAIVVAGTSDGSGTCRHRAGSTCHPDPTDRYANHRIHCREGRSRGWGPCSADCRRSPRCHRLAPLICSWGEYCRNSAEKRPSYSLCRGPVPAAVASPEAQSGQTASAAKPANARTIRNLSSRVAPYWYVMRS